MTSSVVSGPVAPRDVSITLTGTAQQLVPYNPNRTHLQFQCNAGQIFYSYTNPLCTSGSSGCYALGAGQVWAPTVGIPQNAIYVNGTNGQLLVATEC